MFVLAGYCGDGQIKEDEMGGICYTCGERDINHQTHTLNTSTTLYFCLIHNLSNHPHACNQLALCLTVDCFFFSSCLYCQVC